MKIKIIFYFDFFSINFQNFQFFYCFYNNPWKNSHITAFVFYRPYTSIFLAILSSSSFGLRRLVRRLFLLRQNDIFVDIVVCLPLYWDKIPHEQLLAACLVSEKQRFKSPQPNRFRLSTVRCREARTWLYTTIRRFK